MFLWFSLLAIGGRGRDFLYDEVRLLVFDVDFNSLGLTVLDVPFESLDLLFLDGAALSLILELALARDVNRFNSSISESELSSSEFRVDTDGVSSIILSSLNSVVYSFN